MSISQNPLYQQTCDIREEVPIPVLSTGEASNPPRTLLSYLHDNAREIPHKTSMLAWRNKAWIKMSWSEVKQQVIKFSKSLIKAGVQERKCTNIIGWNAPEWTISYLGSLMAGVIAVGVYPTNNPEACGYIAQHSEANILIAENMTQVQKYQAYMSQFSKIIVYNEEIQSHGNIYSWNDWINFGSDISDEEVIQRENRVTPATCATIVYTSGTTGPPKGVMLSHDSLAWTNISLVKHELAGTDLVLTDEEQVLSYLPLNHITGQQTDIIIPIIFRQTVWYCGESAIKGELLFFFTHVRPTYFTGVPRMWEKIIEGIKKIFIDKNNLEILAKQWGKQTLDKALWIIFSEHSDPKEVYNQNREVSEKIKQFLGMERLKGCYAGSAPMFQKVFDFFYTLGIHIVTLYGMSESAGGITANNFQRQIKRSAGTAIPGIDLQILDEKNNPVPPRKLGEICWRGRCNLMGYYKNPKATKDTFDKNGFLHSGDEGYMDEFGSVFITGRYKEIIITSGGENIPPLLIEHAVKEMCPIISQFFVVGDNRKYLTALVTLKLVMDQDGNVTRRLTEDAVKFLKQELNLDLTVVDQCLDNQVLKKYIDGVVQRYNKEKAVSSAQTIKYWSLIDSDFSPKGGELTPTLKLRRSFVVEKYKKEIELLYSRARL